jgi:hypothetical protein
MLAWSYGFQLRTGRTRSTPFRKYSTYAGQARIMPTKAGIHRDSCTKNVAAGPLSSRAKRGICTFAWYGESRLIP